jgi:hypothetical protein
MSKTVTEALEGSRLVNAIVGGVWVKAECPLWCIADHTEAGHETIEHRSRKATASVVEPETGFRRKLTLHLVAFLHEDGRSYSLPCVSVHESGWGQVEFLDDPAQLRAMAHKYGSPKLGRLANRMARAIRNTRTLHAIRRTELQGVVRSPSDAAQSDPRDAWAEFMRTACFPCSQRSGGPRRGRMFIVPQSTSADAPTD